MWTIEIIRCKKNNMGRKHSVTTKKLKQTVEKFDEIKLPVPGGTPPVEHQLDKTSKSLKMKRWNASQLVLGDFGCSI